MPTIRDVVQVLGARRGIDAVVVLGRDGLTIDSKSDLGIDADGVAALIPSIVESCGRLGEASSRGDLQTGIIEFSDGLVVVAALTDETLLAILVHRDTNIGQLLHELRRHRASIANLL